MREGGMGGIIGLVIIGILIWGGYNLFFKSEKWNLLYESSRGVIVNQGEYNSKEDCLDELDAIGGQNFGAECSRGCEQPDDPAMPWLCDETIDG